MVVQGKVIIHEMDAQDGYYSIHFEGTVEEFGFNDISDYLSAEETQSIIVWDGIKPAWN